MRLSDLLVYFLSLGYALSCSAQEPIEILGSDSGLKNPFGVAFDNDNNMLIAEYLGGRLWKYSKSSGLQQLAKDTKFNGMHNLALTRDGHIFISDTRANLIRKLNERTGKVTIVCGTGEAGYNGDGIPAIRAQLADPISISLSPDDKRLYIADIKNFRVRFIDLDSGIIHTAAGNGTSEIPKPGTLAKESPLLDPRGVAEDSLGNLYILSRRGHALRVVRADGRIYSVAGNGKPHAADGPALQAGLNGPKHICIDIDDSVIIADAENHLIKRYDPIAKTLLTILDHGPDGTPLNRPHGVWVRPDGTIYICDSWNNRILKLAR
ncbi:MAG: hypothetical protein ACKVGW_06195 [Verrucomicrobiia bacterium]